MRKITEQPGGRTRMLPFDGGGIRRLFALQYAKSIEMLLREKAGKPDLVPADHSHFIGGTSTGAIIAAFLSWGLSVEEIGGLYRKNAIAMFIRSGWLKRFTSQKFVAKGLTDSLQNFLVEDDARPANLGTAKLKTLLPVVTRNTSTGSLWPISNNPDAKYNNPESPENNLQIPLWHLVRTSTAAPTFFPPEILEVKGEHGEALEFASEDGGITPSNNPAYLIKIIVTLPEYRLGWESGSDRMALVTIGTGGTKAAGRSTRSMCFCRQKIFRTRSSDLSSNTRISYATSTASAATPRPLRARSAILSAQPESRNIPTPAKTRSFRKTILSGQKR
jgi:hypothetical protein